MKLYTKIAIAIVLVAIFAVWFSWLTIGFFDCLGRGGVPVILPHRTMCAAKLP